MAQRQRRRNFIRTIVRFSRSFFSPEKILENYVILNSPPNSAYVGYILRTPSMYLRTTKPPLSFLKLLSLAYERRAEGLRTDPRSHLGFVVIQVCFPRVSIDDVWALLLGQAGGSPRAQSSSSSRQVRSQRSGGWQMRRGFARSHPGCVTWEMEFSSAPPRACCC